MSGRSELARRGGAEGVAHELDLSARAGPVIEIEQQVADRPPLDRGDQSGDSLGIGGRDGGDFGGVEIADAAELAGSILAREREHAGPWRAFFLEDDQRAGGIQEKMELRR